jgi:apolipoprotein N-acyltransferase
MWVVALRWLPKGFELMDQPAATAGWPALAVMSGILSLFWSVPFALARKLANKNAGGQLLATSSLFALGEWARSTTIVGFAWNPLGAIWLEVPAIVRSASVIGITGLSFATLLAAGLVLQIARYPRRVGASLGFIAGLAILLGRLSIAPPDTAQQVALIQGNIPQAVKWDESRLNEQVNIYLDLTASISSSAAGVRIFWPEAAIPYVLEDRDAVLDAIGKTLRTGDMLFAGSLSRGVDGEYANSVYLIDAGGRVRGRYDKRILVPFGEYVPFGSLLEALHLARYAPGHDALSSGPAIPAIPLVGGKAGVAICFEATFPGFGFGFTSRPDYIVNPSNDAWFGPAGAPQHLAQARIRALESGLPVLRATQTGISAIIRSDGSIADHLESGVRGVLVGRLPATAQATVFSKIGPAYLIVFLLGSLGPILASSQRNAVRPARRSCRRKRG